MKVVSLFSGCGGLDWGFKKAGYKIVWANDILSDACISYEKNIGRHIVCDDITRIDPNDIPPADIVIGGPPCQGFSPIGKRDPKDKRSALVWNFLEVIKSVNPKVFLFENVTGIKSAIAADDSKILDNFKAAFDSTDYNIEVNTLNAANYGVPQMRKRVFIVGTNLKSKIGAPEITHSEKETDCRKWVSSFNALSDLGTPTDSGIADYKKHADNEFLKFVRRGSKRTSLHITPYASPKDKEIIKHVKPGGNYMDVPDEVATSRILYFKKTGGRTTTYGRLNPDRPAYTLNTHFNRPNIGCNIHYGEARLITIREGMRLQSFQDKFTLHSSNKRNYYVQVGNAVPPLVGLAWANHIKALLS